MREFIRWISWLTVMMVAAVTMAAPEGWICVEFEDPPLGAEYGVGDMFTDNGVALRLVPFQSAGGTWTSGGMATIRDDGLAGGSGQELWLNNIAVELVANGCIQDLRLGYGNYGGNMNLRINGEFVNLNHMTDIDGMVIGGVEVDVTPANANQGVIETFGVIHSFSIGGQEFAIDEVCFAKCDAEPCIEFESLPEDGKYGVGASVADSGVPMAVRPFQYGNGEWTSEGVAAVSTDGNAGGSGQEMGLANANLQFQFAGCLQKLTFLYGHLGGNLNLSVNGEFLNFDRMTDLHGVMVGQVLVTVSGPQLPDRGMVTLTGRIDGFSVGGQEFWIDRICPESCVEQLCMEFQDPPPASTYQVGESFVDTGVPVQVRPFQWESGEWTDKGMAAIDDQQRAGGWGQDVQANNVNLAFQFRRCVGGLSLLFGEYGGNVNLRINGDLRNVPDFANLDGLVVGGVAVSVVNGFGNDQGRLMLVGRIDTFAIGGQELWVDHLCPVFCPQQECVEFEDHPLGTQYGVGDTFVDSGVPFSVGEFEWSDGTWTGDGRATITGNQQAGGWGRDINLNNVNLILGSKRLTIPCLSGLTLLFGEYGGNVNLQVNGDYRNFDNFADIHGAVIGGVEVSVTNGFGNDRGRVRLRGRIDSFSVGGQELWIDHICIRPCPETECIEFEDPPLGHSYLYKDTFTDSGVTFGVDEFELTGGSTTTDGHVRTADGGLAGGSGHDANVNNARLTVIDGTVWPDGLTFLFGEYGGNLNLVINGDLANFDNFADVDGATIGGVDLHVVNGFGNDRGRVEIVGPVDEFAVGGQELYVDRICPRVTQLEIPPRIVSIERGPGGVSLGLQFRHATSDPLAYQLERSPAPGDGAPWGDDPDGVISPVGGSTYNASTPDPAAIRRTYRVRGEP